MLSDELARAVVEAAAGAGGISAAAAAAAGAAAIGAATAVALEAREAVRAAEDNTVEVAGAEQAAAAASCRRGSLVTNVKRRSARDVTLHCRSASFIASSPSSVIRSFSSSMYLRTSSASSRANSKA